MFAATKLTKPTPQDSSGPEKVQTLVLAPIWLAPSHAVDLGTRSETSSKSEVLVVETCRGKQHPPILIKLPKPKDCIFHVITILTL